MNSILYIQIANISNHFLSVSMLYKYGGALRYMIWIAVMHFKQTALHSYVKDLAFQIRPKDKPR